MTDLASAIPPHEPAEDALALVGGMGLDAIPVIGPMAGRAFDHALLARDRQRRHAFDLRVVAAIQDVAEQVDDALTVGDVIASDEFLAALTRTSRIASETASESKRRRLAAATANSGDWAPFTPDERTEFIRIVETIEDIHVWMLHFFQGSWRSLAQRDLSTTFRERLETMEEAGSPLDLLLGDDPTDARRTATLQALTDVTRTHLVWAPPNLDPRSSDVVKCHTSSKGGRFLEFVLSAPADDTSPLP